LEQAGHDIQFYVLPGRIAAYGEAIDFDLLDVRRRMWGERVCQRWPVRYRDTLEPDHDFDLIVLSVPHYRLADAADFLAPRVGNATVLIFSNVWSEPLAALGALAIDQVAWGFPGAGGGF
jgi:2-dehydropantoate 2-reductase